MTFLIANLRVASTNALIFTLLACAGLCGCGGGVSRTGIIYSFPDTEMIEVWLREHPKISDVVVYRGPLNALTPRKKNTSSSEFSDYAVYFLYTNLHDSNQIIGELSFVTDNANQKIRYSQGFLLPEQAQNVADQTWPIMLEIEEMLINDFGLIELKKGVTITIHGVEHPSRNKEAKKTMELNTEKIEKQIISDNEERNSEKANDLFRDLSK